MKFRTAPRNTRALLTMEGECARPTAFTQHDLASLMHYYQVPDLAQVDERLRGTAVRLRKLIDIAGPGLETRFLTVESEDGEYSVSLPIDEVAPTALVVYALDGKPLGREDGGPVRFLVPFHADACVNVKGASRIVLSARKGRDTRPSQAASVGARDG